MKGYVYTLEVLIVASIIMIALSLTFKVATLKPETGLAILENRGINAIEFLDSNEDLRDWVSKNNETLIENKLRELIPRSAEIDFSTTCNTINIPKNVTTIAIPYYISGYKDTYDPKKVCLYLWEAFP